MNVLVIGAHPDDCEIRCGGIALLYRRLGHRVKFISATNGVTGHHAIGGIELARRRYHEAQEVGRVLDVEYEVLDIQSGDLEPTLLYRKRFIELIRGFRADLIFTHRPNDYHPDHRYTSQLVQDSSYVLTVPNNMPLSEHLPQMPVICYMWDNFQRPYPFAPDVAVDITPVMETKLRAIHCNTSQMYEWLPFNSGILDQVPADDEARFEWLRGQRAPQNQRIADESRELLRRLYGDAADGVVYAESFEGCEYGKRLTNENRRTYFPMLPEVG